MPQFSRRTILAAADILATFGHTGVTQNAGIDGPLQARANGLARYLLAHPEDTDPDGRNLTDVIIESLVGTAIARSTVRYPDHFDYQAFQRDYRPENYRTTK